LGFGSAIQFGVSFLPHAQEYNGYIGSHVARIYQTRHNKQVATNPDTSLKTSAAYLIYYCSDTFSIRLY